VSFGLINFYFVVVVVVVVLHYFHNQNFINNKQQTVATEATSREIARMPSALQISSSATT
jgi:uncharacterized protein (UPF0333 family)